MSPREKLRNRPPREKGCEGQIQDTDAPRHQRGHQHEQRKDQERTVDVRILEGRADAVIEQEPVGARQQVKEADVARHRGDQRREEVAAAENSKAAPDRRRQTGTRT